MYDPIIEVVEFAPLIVALLAVGGVIAGVRALIRGVRWFLEELSGSEAARDRHTMRVRASMDKQFGKDNW